MTDLDAKALDRACKAAWEATADKFDCSWYDAASSPDFTGDVANHCKEIEAAIRTYLSASGIGAVVEAARAACVEDRKPLSEWKLNAAVKCMACLHAAVAALDKEPGHE